MGIFFGTDGLRGKVNNELSFDIAYKVGNAIGTLKPNAKVLIGCDTRKSGSLLTSAVSGGLMNAGVNVTDIGICPTAGIAYLTKHFEFDFGIVISASHNTAEFNGIKVLDSTGKKLGDNKENEIERRFLQQIAVKYDKIGTYTNNPRLVIAYEKFLANSIQSSLKGKTIVLDCSNGVSYKIAPAVFRDHGAKIISTFCKPDGLNINAKCGSLHIEKLQHYVKKYKADMGFAFDGDSDRVIAVDEKCQVVDGDKIIYLLAKTLKEQNGLQGNAVVGTQHTNMGVEVALKKLGIELLRTDIGDKYVSQKLIEKDLLIGGEQSGHIFIRNKLLTGDGILTALTIAEIVTKSNKNLSQFFDFDLFYQTNINVKVNDKIRIINSEVLANAIEKEENLLGKNGRTMIRVSGTEPFIRIMVETKDEKLSKESADRLKTVIEYLNEEFDICVE